MSETLTRRCANCDKVLDKREYVLCRDCDTLPMALRVALDTDGAYLLTLRTGEMVQFTRAHRTGAFVHLDDARIYGYDRKFALGIDVRLGDVTWCADVSKDK